jgi:hypothetical protein
MGHLADIETLILPVNGAFSHKSLIEAYGTWVESYRRQGWDGYLFGFLFDHVPGSMEAQIQQMYRDITQVYGRLATRSVRRPRSPKWVPLLPKGVFIADFPVPMWEKQRLRNVVINDGLHVHGLVMANRRCRIDQPLDLHFSKNQETYLIGKIRRIHVEPISSLPHYVTDYGLKALKRGRITQDHILILPKALRELSGPANARQG